MQTDNLKPDKILVRDHIVELFIPTQCGDCREPLLDGLREALLDDMKGRFSDAFGGFSVTRIHGGWKMPDGTLAEEPVDVLWAKSTNQELEEHGEEVRLWAVEAADRLSQDSVALCIDQDVGLDPELSGKVFENLLAAYNPETGATARKQTGSFYTPREIVNYMVDEALIAYLETKVAQSRPVGTASSGGVPPPGPIPGGTPGKLAGGTPALQVKLRHLFAYNDEPHQFTAPDGTSLNVRTAWYINPGGGALRFVTVHPLPKL